MALISVEYSNLYPVLFFDEQKANNFFQRIFSLHEHKFKGVLSVVFLDEEEHCKLHGRFLKDYRPTDVITFQGDSESEIVGEICVSVDKAIEESKNQNLSFDMELCLYLIHGWLHLVGFDDKTEIDRSLMKREEKNVMCIIEKDKLWPNFVLAQNLQEG